MTAFDDAIARMFATDAELHASVSRAFDPAGAGEVPVAFLWSNDTLGVANAKSSTWILATDDRLGLGKKSGHPATVVPRTAVASIGVGASTVGNNVGLTMPQETDFVSLTITLTSGAVHVQHCFVGANAAQTQQGVPVVVGQLEAMSKAGYPFQDGPGWDFTKGMAFFGGRGIGIGLGIIAGL